jgi:hypothetical protein
MYGIKSIAKWFRASLVAGHGNQCREEVAPSLHKSADREEKTLGSEARLGINHGRIQSLGLFSSIFGGKKYLTFGGWRVSFFLDGARGGVWGNTKKSSLDIGISCNESIRGGGRPIIQILISRLGKTFRY